MSYAPALPSFPCMPRPEKIITVEPFVNESAIAPLLHRPAIEWREKRYLGEDFAGLEEYSAPLPQSQQKTVSPILADERWDAPESISVSEVDAGSPPMSTSVWRNAVAMGSAAAIVIAAALGGLWAAHATTPAHSDNGNAKVLGSLPQRSALTQPR